MKKYFSPLVQKKIALTLLAGLCYVLGFPSYIPFHFFIFPIIGISILFTQLNGLSYFNEIILEKISSHQLKEIVLIDAFLLLLFLLIINFGGFGWLSQTIHEFGEIPSPLNYLIGTLFVFIVMPHFFVFLSLIYILSWFFTFKKCNSYFLKNSRSQTLFLSLLFCLTEYFTPSLFPAHLGHPYIGLSPYLPFAPIGGVPFYSFISAWVSFNFVSNKINKKAKQDILPFILYILFLGVHPFFPLKNNFVEIISAKTDQIIDRSSNEHHSVEYFRIVQANIGNVFKIAAENGYRNAIHKTLESYKDLSLKNSQLPLDTIIWPETAYPFPFKKNRFIPTSSILMKTINQSQKYFIIGTYLLNDHPSPQFPDYESVYNSIFHISPDGELLNYYNKSELIPFGETLPFSTEINKWIGSQIPALSFFARGDTFSLFQTRKGHTFIPLICYEILSPNFLRKYLKAVNLNPHFIINLTNDSWYLPPEPLQHLFLGRWRAVEFQIPIVRATNTGISTIILPNGLLGPSIEFQKMDILDFGLKFSKEKKGQTYYEKFGLNVTLLFFILLYLIQIIRQKIKIKKT